MTCLFSTTLSQLLSHQLDKHSLGKVWSQWKIFFRLITNYYWLSSRSQQKAFHYGLLWKAMSYTRIVSKHQRLSMLVVKSRCLQLLYNSVLAHCLQIQMQSIPHPLRMDYARLQRLPLRSGHWVRPSFVSYRVATMHLLLPISLTCFLSCLFIRNAHEVSWLRSHPMHSIPFIPWVLGRRICRTCSSSSTPSY